jgi:hypothetical protein
MSGAGEAIGLLETSEPREDDGRPLIFLSYGRADASDLAERLESDLGGEYRIWRDRSAIRGGGAFASTIRDAIERAALVVGILSPHAMRDGATGDKQSFCLNELQEAHQQLGKPVVLAMAETANFS